MRIIDKQQHGLLFFIALFFTALILPIVNALPAAAANPTATWTSNGSPAQIAFNGKLFTQQSVTNGSTTKMMRLTAPGACSSSPDLIEVGLGNISPNNDYHTATQALTFTFPSSCQFAGNGVATDLTNTFNNITGGNSGGNNDQFTWVDSITIKDLNTSNLYKKSQLNDNGTMTLTGPQIGSECSPEVITIGDSTNSYMTATTATLTIVQFIENPASSSHGSCQASTKTITVLNPYISVGTTGHWTPNAIDPDASIIIDNVGVDANTFLNVGDTYLESSKNPINGQDMTLLFPSTCKVVNDNAMHVNPYTIAANATVSVSRDNGHGCTKATLPVALTNTYGSDSTGPPTTNPVSGNDGCNVPTANEPLRWIECPVISTLQGFASAINGFIGQQLSVPNGIFFNDGTQKVFNIFRNIGVAMLVLAGLIMVVSQAADLELFAAHTVRKALPRLIIVAILISISWPLLQFIIGFFNDIGFWTGKIILSVTSYTNAGGGDAGTIMSNIADGLILGLVAAGGIVLLGAGGIISLLVSFILFTIIGVFVLMIREIIILLCILITPLALASFVLPGTEKIGKFWQDTLITTLVMFPLIEGFLASGTALASIILSVKSGDYGYHIVAMLVFIAPYMALPFAFKLAGGLIGRVIEFAEGTHNKTIESRLQGYRQNQTAKNLAATKAGSRWNPDSRWTNFGGRYNPFNGRTINSLGRHVGAGMRGRFGIGAVGRVAMANNMGLSADAASKMDTNFAAQMNNEDAMAAVAFGNDRARLERLTAFRGPANRDRLNRALAAGQTIQATQQMQAAAADALVRSGKVLENRDEFSSMVDSIAHGNTAYAGALDGNLRYTARQIGRADWGRANDYDSLKEMDMSAVIRQKPKSLENLFGSNKVTRTAVNPTGSAVVDAINGSRDRNERQHFADILFAAQYNQSISPEQQKSIAEAINVISRHPIHGAGGSGTDLIAQARTNYRDKFSPGGGTPSDKRLKRDIHLVQTLASGIKLYSFQYNWGGPHYVGVMAQDLLNTHPEAVVLGADGYYRVDYEMLGLRMTQLAQWQATSRRN